MLISRITLNLTGKNFWPTKFLERVNGNYLITDQNNPTDFIWDDKKEIYDFGSLSIQHPKQFGLQHDEWLYDKWYVSFVEDNHIFFDEYDIDEIVFYTEIYYCGDQCNIEMFNSELLKKISNIISFSLPVSVYKLTQNEIIDMLLSAGFDRKEIIENW
jgi:hypothetical protein